MVSEKELLDKKVLLVDDEEQLLNLLEEVLYREGFKNIYKAATGIDGILNAKEIKPDIILLDVNLPDIEGYLVCDKIRKFSFCPIIFLTAKGEDKDKLNGLEAGGDDYVTKPFNIKEVVLRIKAQLRRNSYSPLEEKKKEFSFGDITINEDNGEVLKGDKLVKLTATEYQLLLFLSKNPNKIFSKSSLCTNVWNYDYEGYDNTIMVHIRHLREKIEDDPGSPRYIKTLKGLGYKLVVK
ncbi:response regulator transcription factor [Clostridium neuense]|uniref:Stage 0 sporulation protein A homolog n=1 Tax=Clostridium neuense TaxID=1728934 RepID=A0ABW8TEG1_9CLOT